MSFRTNAEQHPKVGLVHVYPSSLVIVTQSFGDKTLPPWFRFTWKLVSSAAGLFSVKADEIGEGMLGFTSPRFGGM